MIQFLISGVAFIFIISLIVFIHEGGHYLVAKWAGVKVETFSLGFGKEVWGFNDKSGTRWCISSLPLGGYVKMYGDATEASSPVEEIEKLSEEDKNKTFHYKPLYKKALIVVAGPLFNFLLTIAVLTVMVYTHGIASSAPIVGELTPDLPAAKAGLKVNDRILSINGTTVTLFSDISRVLVTNLGTPVSLEIKRNGKPMSITLTPVMRKDMDPFGNAYEHPVIGITHKIEFQNVSLPYAFLGAIDHTVDLCATTLRVVQQIVAGERAAKDIIKGPLGMAKLSGQAAERGIEHTFLLIALISANLGLVNLFPIPMLDGGHLLFYAIEAITGTPPGKRFQEYGMRIGMAMIVMLMAYAILNDLRGWMVGVASK